MEMCIYSCTSANDGSVNVNFVIFLVQGSQCCNIVKGEIETRDMRSVTLFGFAKPGSNNNFVLWGLLFAEHTDVF